MTAHHYLYSLLWTAELESSTFSVHRSSLRRVARDWRDFKRQATALGFNPETDYKGALHPDNEGDPWNQAAHDFALTRNHHGTGFWDRELSGHWRTELTRLSHQFGEVYCSADPDAGYIYIE